MVLLVSRKNCRVAIAEFTSFSSSSLSPPCHSRVWAWIMMGMCTLGFSGTPNTLVLSVWPRVLSFWLCTPPYPLLPLPPSPKLLPQNGWLICAVERGYTILWLSLRDGTIRLTIPLQMRTLFAILFRLSSFQHCTAVPQLTFAPLAHYLPQYEVLYHYIPPHTPPLVVHTCISTTMSNLIWFYYSGRLKYVFYIL